AVAARRSIALVRRSACPLEDELGHSADGRIDAAEAVLGPSAWLLLIAVDSLPGVSDEDRTGCGCKYFGGATAANDCAVERAGVQERALLHAGLQTDRSRASGQLRVEIFCEEQLLGNAALDLPSAGRQHGPFRKDAPTVGKAA